MLKEKHAKDSHSSKYPTSHWRVYMLANLSHELYSHKAGAQAKKHTGTIVYHNNKEELSSRIIKKNYFVFDVR